MRLQSWPEKATKFVLGNSRGTVLGRRLTPGEAEESGEGSVGIALVVV